MDTEDFIKKGLVDGNELAYQYLYQKHYAALCAFAYQYVKDNYIAETMVGDVIFYLWRKRQELVIEQSLRNYLMKAVKNRCLNHLKQSKLQGNLKNHFSERLETNEKNYENQSEYPLSHLLETELDARIQDALGTLPELTRKIFELSRFSDLKYQEIALTVGMSNDSVKYHIKSALSHLRKKLKDYLLMLVI